MSPWFGLILVTAFAAVGVILILTAGAWWRGGSSHDASKGGRA